MKENQHEQHAGNIFSYSRQIIRIMRLSLFLLIVSTAMSFSAVTYSQSTRLTLEMENATMKEVFRAIEDQSDFLIFYREGQIDLNRRVSVHSAAKQLKEILDEIFKGTDNIYIISDRQVVIGRAPRKELEAQLTALQKDIRTVIEQPQQKEITGKVTDSQGEPLPGATVVVKGSSIGTVTDMNGFFSLNIPVNTETIQISFVGMNTQEIAVTGRNTFNVVLEESAFTLEEVVAIGYGTQQKVNLTGAIGTINAEGLIGKVSTSATSLLQGRLPGVFVTEGSGQPGRTNMNILIRGVGTMNNSRPMVLVDGIESTMDDINPNDIESVNILKDAASAAIYGTRAANGVILVTTKRGELGKVKVSFNASLGSQQLMFLPKGLDSWDQATLINEASLNSNLPPVYTDSDIQKFKSGVDPYNYPNTDWRKLVLQGSGLMQIYSLNFSGGTEAARFLLSMESYEQKGLIEYSDYKRNNLRLNIDSKINNWLNIGLNSSLLQSNIVEPTTPAGGGLNGGIGEYFRQLQYIPSTAPLKNEKGEYVPWTNGNPVAWLEQGGRYTSNNSHVVGSIFAEINLMKGLTLKGIMGLNYSYDDNKNHQATINYSNGLVQGPNAVNDILSRNSTVTLQSYLTYVNSFKDHNIKAMFGVDHESTEYKYDALYRNNLPSNELDQISAGASSSMTNSGTASDIKIGSYFGRINYNYEGKYLFELNFRRDGSSKFGPGYRWGTFPSSSVGWRMSEEEFMKDLTWLDNLKLRGSLGNLGNHNIGNYLYMSTISLGLNYPFNGGMQNGAASTKAEVPNISWEKTKEWDIGLDADFFQYKFSVSVDYYNRYTSDILTSVPVSPVFGLPAPVVNAGAMRNKGVEILLNHKNTIGGLEYNLSGNISFNNNKVEKFPVPSIGNTIRMEGYSWDSYFGYECTGIYQTDEEAASSPHIVGADVKAGDLIYKDQNGDKVIDTKDRVDLGNQIPEITYGFDLNLMYKNFDLTMDFQGVANVYNTIGDRFYAFADGGTGYERHLDRNIVENGKVVKEGYYPRTLMNPMSTHNGIFSSFQVLNSSYLRLKNLQLGYSLPQRLTEKVKLSKVRVYFSGKNLLTVTKFLKDYDPEIRGAAHYIYPQVRIFTFGLNVNF